MKRLSRRTFMKAAGASVAMLPAVFNSAYAQQTGAPLRFVALVSRNGQFDSLYYPNFSDGQLAQVGTNGVQVRSGKLSDIAGPISPIFHSAFDGVRSKMSIVRGLDICSNRLGHNMCAPLCASTTTGAIYAPPTFKYSADHTIAQSIYAAEPVTRSLRLTSRFDARTYRNSWSWDGSETRLPVQGDLTTVFNTLFSSVGAPEIDPVAQLNRSVVDGLRHRISPQELRNLGQTERNRVEQFFTQLQQAQESVEVVRSACQTPQLSGDLGESRNSNEIVYDAIFDMIGGAFACDLTRVAVIDMDHAKDEVVNDTAWHDSSHHPEVGDPTISLGYNAWVGDRVAAFLNHLDSLIDIDGNTVLDNTIVLWTNELSWGNTHAVNGMPVMLAGAGSKFVNGEYIDFRQVGAGQIVTERNLDEKSVGLPYNRLLISIMAAMGLTPDDYEPVSGQGFGDYNAIDGQSAHYDSLLADRRATLQYLYR